MKKTLFFIILLVIGIISYSQAIKVACVGNSITYGHGIEGRDSLAYPPQLEKILGNEWEVKNFGNSGSTMLKTGNKPYWIQPEFQLAQKYQPDIVIIKLGTNDSKPRNWDGHSQEYIEDYREMIKIFQDLDSHPLVFLGIPIMVTKDTWDIKKKVVDEEIIPLIKQLANDQGLVLIDFYSSLKNHPEYIFDNVHPNAEGSALMAHEAAKVLLQNKEKIQTR